MQQSIVDKPARRRRGSFLSWPKRLPASVGIDRPRGNGRAALSNTYLLRAGGVLLVYPPCLVFISFACTTLYWCAVPAVPLAAVAIGFGPQWLAWRSLAMLADGAEEEPLPSARRGQSR